MKNRTSKIDIRANWLAFLLILYIYIPFFWNIIEHTFAISFIYQYILYFMIAVAVLIGSLSINKKVFAFLMIFSLILLINYLIVPYNYFVAVEGIQALVGISIPCLCVSARYFDLRVFTQKWYKFAQYNLPLLLIAVVLVKINLAHYSIFTGICVPNVFILSFMVLSGIKKGKWLYLNAIINIVIIAILGGRMATVASICMLLFAIIYSGKVKLWKKVIIIAVLLIATALIWINFSAILLWINEKLTQYGVHSRSITLMINQLKNNELYVAGRDDIYSLCIEYVKGRMGLPGGFGIPLYLTSGQYYYAHNIVLQMIIFFGIWGSIPITGIILLRFRTLKRIAPKETIQLLWFMMGSYIVIGMTGSSIWIHYLSTIFIACFFFGNARLYSTMSD